MAKRSIILGTIFVISLLIACIYGFLSMKQQTHPVRSSVLFNVIPPDALAIQRFRSFEDLCEAYASPKAFLMRFCTPENGISHFLRETYSAKNDLPVFSKLFRSQAILSLHYTGKNSVQTLLGIQYTQGEHTFQQLCDELGGATHYKNYNKVDIYQLFGGSKLLYIAFMEGFLLAGTSPVVVESSILHLVNGRSLMDNQTFASLPTLSSATAESSVYVNMQQTDKLFGSLLGIRMQRHADFFTKSASWLALDGTVSGDLVDLDGHLVVDKGDANYFTTLCDQTPASIKTWEAVPSSTLAFISFSLSDFAQYKKRYDNFLEIHKKNKQTIIDTKAWEARMETNLNQWFQSLHPAEVALAWVPVKGGYEWVTLVRSNQIQQARKHLDFPASDPKQPAPVLPNPAVGAFSTLFGSFFAKSSESHYTVMDNTLFFGSQDLLESLRSGYNKSLSLYSVMKQGRIKGKWMEESGLTCVLQAAEARDSLIQMCAPRYIPLIKEALTSFQGAWTIFQISSIGDKPYARILFSADNRQRTTVPAPVPVPMAVGSFKIFNHASRKNEELEQKADSTLVLKDVSGKQNWRTRRKYAIVDQVVQIDYYKNDKLQMLFASEGTELCLLDILGRLVTPFPVKMEIPVIKGPFLFDLKSNKDYQIFLIHSDNSLRLYDRSGAAVPDWRPFIPEDRIEHPPILLTYPQGHYWLVYGTQKDYILKPDGTIAVVLQRRNRLKQDAGVTIDADGVLNGFTTEERILTVQLSTGTIKTRKP